MKFYSLACFCGCKDPLIKGNGQTGNEFIIIYRSRVQAELAASSAVVYDLQGNPTDKHPLVKEFEISEVAASE